ncbi:MAG: hypothetical protein CV087_23345 [Candidatus Brocadia sp. WS118]|nr:MAG: hypothetical protein CV087_23345 [Candidatus Brocadia sp. WS118]
MQFFVTFIEKNAIFHRDGVFLQMRSQVIRFNKKKCFKEVLEIGQNFDNGRGLKNLACFRTSVSLLQKLK